LQPLRLGAFARDYFDSFTPSDAYATAAARGLASCAGPVYVIGRLKSKGGELRVRFGDCLRMRSKYFYGLTIFAGAFLLFQVQPIVGKLILPGFGGSARVWIVCLLFFQTVLLLGYAHAHGLTHKFPLRAQVRIHSGLLLASVMLLPVLPKVAGKLLPGLDPALQILGVLAATVGLPAFLLSSTSPLLQAWYAQKGDGATPYRFYAVSNTGSMLALLSYPLVMEPWVATSFQAVAWSWGYAAFVILCVALAFTTVPNSPLAKAPVNGDPPDWKLQTLWLSLAACGSALLLAVTHHITQNLAALPLLWVIPLALYLLSFILCFEGGAWYRRGLFLRLLGVTLGSLAYALAPSFAGLPLRVAVPLFCGGLFVCCMFCHGELARLKPHPAYLTSFYLMCALGGVLGALFVAVLAPHVFSGSYELRIALGCCALLVLVVHHRDPSSPFYRARWQPDWLLMVGVAAAIIVSLGVTAREEAAGARLMVRNFYGVLRVVDGTAPSVVMVGGRDSQVPVEVSRYEKLMNGTIDHGLQFLAPERRDLPTSYYGPESGAGIVLKAADPGTPLKVGLIGLGVGTLAAYGRPGDQYKFYEINPLVIQVANREFCFLRDSKARIGVVEGDGRLSLEQEPPQGFDVLAVDAFSGDAIPVHLLTREAFRLYFRHLKPHGTLAVHVSNKYLNLNPVVAGAAEALGMEAVLVNNKPDSPRGISRSTWVLVGNPRGFLGKAEVENAGTVLGPGALKIVWTDDYSSLMKALM